MLHKSRDFFWGWLSWILEVVDLPVLSSANPTIESERDVDLSGELKVAPWDWDLYS
jgi:hypothetical protein